MWNQVWNLYELNPRRTLLPLQASHFLAQLENDMFKKLFIIFIRPSFDGRIMVWRCQLVRPYVHPYVASSTILVGRIKQELFGLGCSNLVLYFVWTEEEAYLFSRSKVKFQGH